MTADSLHVSGMTREEEAAAWVAYMQGFNTLHYVDQAERDRRNANDEEVFPCVTQRSRVTQEDS